MFNPDTKLLKTPEERAAVMADAGFDLNKDIVVMCKSGNAASLVFCSLKDIQKGNLALYDGSIGEYNKKTSS